MSGGVLCGCGLGVGVFSRVVNWRISPSSVSLGLCTEGWLPSAVSLGLWIEAYSSSVVSLRLWIEGYSPSSVFLPRLQPSCTYFAQVQGPEYIRSVAMGELNTRS